jgi:hypothetical protein
MYVRPYVCYIAVLMESTLPGSLRPQSPAPAGRSCAGNLLGRSGPVYHGLYDTCFALQLTSWSKGCAVYRTVVLLCCIGALECCISTGRLHAACACPQRAHTSNFTQCLVGKLKVSFGTAAGTVAVALWIRFSTGVWRADYFHDFVRFHSGKWTFPTFSRLVPTLS